MRLLLLFLLASTHLLRAEEKPNIFFFFADDWGRYASAYSDPENPSLNDVIQTPHIDRIGREGVIFENAFVPVASCGPCRASLATGKYFWNCGSGAFLNGKNSNWSKHENPFPRLPKFGDLLREQGGYFVRKSRKTFAFDDSKSPEWKQFGLVGYERYGLYVGEAKNAESRKQRHEEVVENSRREIQRLLHSRQEEEPFFFVFGSINVHRPYTPDSGKELWGIDPDSLKGLIPPFLPDVEDVRRDFSDYLGEILALDLMLGVMLEELENAGELDNTLVILSGDHGIPGVPRGKTNCYDLATRVPLLARWPKGIPEGRRVEDYVSVMDIGPTLLDLAGVEVPDSMDGKSFHPQLTSSKSGWIDESRDEVIIGRERHYHTARPGNVPYPMRAIRTKKYLYIRNFKPERWPMGDPFEAEELSDPSELYEMGLNTAPAYLDLDGSLTKAFMMSRRAEAPHSELFHLTMEKRPLEELYDLRSDPDQMENLAEDSSAEAILSEFRAQQKSLMDRTQDPRIEDDFDYLPWSDPGLEK